MSCRQIQTIRTSRASLATRMPAIYASTGIVSSDTAIAHDHTRRGTMSLFANLHGATGKVTGQCYQRRPNAEFRKCLGHTRPRGFVRPQTHIVLENHSNYKDRCVSRPLEPPPTRRLTRTPNGEQPK